MAAQAPKWLNIGLFAIGTPLILADAARTSEQLDAVDAQSGANAQRVQSCMAKTSEMISDPSLHKQVCECVVSKATRRGALDSYGRYDESKIVRITSECSRGDWD